MLDLIEENRKIEASGVREVFVPTRPIESSNLLSGRETEIRSIIDGVSQSGQHILLFGDRGIGKTSLAKATCSSIAKNSNRTLIIKSCDKSDTFSTISQFLLEKMGRECIISKEYSTGFSFTKWICSLFADRKKTIQVNNNLSSPSWVADKMPQENYIIILDEIDVLERKEDKQKIAELIKALSDKNSPITIFVVGISKQAKDLYAGHPSVQRCLKEIKLGRMKPNELSEIIQKGEKRLGLTYVQRIKQRIVKVSAGFPYFTHLLALKSAETAIKNDVKEINEDIFNEAINSAVYDVEGTLKSSFDDVVNSSNETYKTRARNILLAASLCADKEDVFTAESIKSNYKLLTNKSITPNDFNNFITKVTSKYESTILKRVSQGTYVFNDPRMPVFIKLTMGSF